MLASDAPLPTGPGWIGEPKMDGWRAIVCVTAGTVTVWSRHGTNLTDRFPEVQSLGDGPDVVLDGELVVYGADGCPDFHALATRPSRRTACLAVFDIISLNGKAVCALIYEQRRQLLERLHLPTCAHPVMTAPVDELWQVTLQHGLEGVVAKRLDSVYRPGRSRSWVRAKHWTITSLPVCGYMTTPGRTLGGTVCAVR